MFGFITQEPFHSSFHLTYMVSWGSFKDGIMLETLLCVPRMNFPFHTEFVLLLLLFNYMLCKMWTTCRRAFGGEGKSLFSRNGLMPVPSSSSQLNPDLHLQYCPVNHLESILINALCLLGPVQRHEGLCLCGLIQFQWYPQ